MICVCSFCFFKQKTAYELRISDWSSDVCSSDLGSLQQAEGVLGRGAHGLLVGREGPVTVAGPEAGLSELEDGLDIAAGRRVLEVRNRLLIVPPGIELGRASCRERGVKYG